MLTEYQLWVFDDSSGWFMRDFFSTKAEAVRALRSWYPDGTSYRVVAVNTVQ